MSGLDAKAVRNLAVTLGPKVARPLAFFARERGLCVTDAKSGSTRPIPVALTPVVLDERELRTRAGMAAHLASAGVKMARHALSTPALRPLVVDALSPLERRLAEAQGARLDALATPRVDFFDNGTLWALELNATIPAMQGYSDIAANAFIELCGRELGFTPPEVAQLQNANGSNAKALFTALLDGYARVRPGQSPARIALLSRRNDAQLTEQQYLARRFSELGVEADVVHPDQLSGDDAVRANGRTYDLVYRHLFVRRLEEPGHAGAEYVTRLLEEPNGTRAVVLNPPASQVEVKAVFALLSAAVEDAALARAAGLTDDELNATRATVPWTRVFKGAALLREARAHPDRFVLKRSWDYGGRAVFVGQTRAESSFRDRAAAAFGAALEWPELCDRAEADARGGGFVIQELVKLQPEPHVLCLSEGPTETELFVDFSAYATVGASREIGWGGVCRGSVSHIVNIVGGGGVLPLLTERVAGTLLERAREQRRI